MTFVLHNSFGKSSQLLPSLDTTQISSLNSEEKSPEQKKKIAETCH